MKIKKEKVNGKIYVTFVPETDEEKYIMGGLRNHYFFGSTESGTYPHYDGITSENDMVTSMKFSYKTWE